MHALVKGATAPSSDGTPLSPPSLARPRGQQDMGLAVLQVGLLGALDKHGLHATSGFICGLLQEKEEHVDPVEQQLREVD